MATVDVIAGCDGKRDRAEMSELSLRWASTTIHSEARAVRAALSESECSSEFRPQTRRFRRASARARRARACGTCGARGDVDAV